MFCADRLHQGMIQITPNPARLAYIDGLRGLTALYIVFCHVYWEMCPAGSDGLPAFLSILLYPFTFSNKVGVFIVLSGYTLTLPLVRSQNLTLRNGTGDFIRRRARRILPPYYAALALTLLLIMTVPQLQTRSGVRWDMALPAFRPGVLLSHVLLLHNLHPNWIPRINTPMWSLAIEWQIYFLFALVLLPLWRRFGFTSSLATAFLLGYLPHFLLPVTWNYDWTSTWYIALFGMGMAAAVCFYWEKAQPFAAVGLVVSSLVLLAMVKLGTGWWNSHRPIADLMVGSSCASFLILATASALSGRPWKFLRWLESKPLQKLGVFSYSLYLVHFPILSLLHAGLRAVFTNSGSGFILTLSLLFLIGVPLSLLVGYGFHLVFERPFVGQTAGKTHSSGSAETGIKRYRAVG